MCRTCPSFLGSEQQPLGKPKVIVNLSFRPPFLFRAAISFWTIPVWFTTILRSVGFSSVHILQPSKVWNQFCWYLLRFNLSLRYRNIVLKYRWHSYSFIPWKLHKLLRWQTVVQRLQWRRNSVNLTPLHYSKYKRTAKISFYKLLKRTKWMFPVRSIQYESKQNVFINIIKISADFRREWYIFRVALSKMSLFAKPNPFSFLRKKISSLALRNFQHRFTTEVYRHSSYWFSDLYLVASGPE